MQRWFTSDAPALTTAGSSITCHGGTQTSTLTCTDWYRNNPPPGGSIVTSAAHPNAATVRRVYFAALPLGPGEDRPLPDPAGRQVGMHLVTTAVG